MLKRAICFFAFSIILFGFSIQMTTSPHPASAQSVSLSHTSTESPPLADIAITNLFLNQKKRLVLTLSNLGNSPFLMAAGNLKIFVDGRFRKKYSLSALSNQSFLPAKESLALTTPFTLAGLREVYAQVETDEDMKELSKENNEIKRILEGLRIGPDIVIKDLDLTEDLELSILVSNAGEIDLREGVTFRILIFVNDLRISEFDHFSSEPLKSNFGNQYVIDPPYRVGISGISRVKISVTPKLPSDDIRLENNTLMRTFIIFPFKIGPQGREEFFVTVPAPKPTEDGEIMRVKAEARWEGTSSFLMLSMSGPVPVKSVPTLSRKSPLTLEIPIPYEQVQQESSWKVSVTNLIEKKVEGHLIIQHP